MNIMCRVFLVHGMNVPDGGKGSIDKLKPKLIALGYEPVDFDYPWRGIIGVLLLNQDSATRLLDEYRPGDKIIAHSNGVAIVAQAIDMGLPVEHCIFIHGALPTEWSPPSDSLVKRIDVYYSGNDSTIGYLAGIYKWIKGPKHYGPLMTFGHTGQNPLFHNHNDGLGHSEGFHTEAGIELFTSTLDT